jgi:hypothetical protein
VAAGGRRMMLEPNPWLFLTLGPFRGSSASAFLAYFLTHTLNASMAGELGIALRENLSGKAKDS